MPNIRLRTLKEFEELLKSINKKLDKIISHQTTEDQGLKSDQKKLMSLIARNYSHFSASAARLGTESYLRLPAPRSIESEGEPSFSANQRNFVPGTFSSLPEHLTQTMQTIAAMGEATAHEVSEKTDRSRAAESDYLNQLVSRGFLKKARKGRQMVFQVFSLHALCTMCGSRVPLNVKYCSYCGALLANLKSPSAYALPRPQNEKGRP